MFIIFSPLYTDVLQFIGTKLVIYKLKKYRIFRVCIEKKHFQIKYHIIHNSKS